MAPGGTGRHILRGRERGTRIAGLDRGGALSTVDDPDMSPQRDSDGSDGSDWGEQVFRSLPGLGVRHVATVPDAGLGRFLELCEADPGIRLITLTTEEEGIALACGTWLGGELAAVAIQSSGVGNIVNMLGLPNVCRIPCLLLVSMRGEAEERNPWQVPVGRAVHDLLTALGVDVFRPESASGVAATFAEAAVRAREAGRPAAVLVSQRIIGAKSFVGGD